METSSSAPPIVGIEVLAVDLESHALYGAPDPAFAAAASVRCMPRSMASIR